MNWIILIGNRNLNIKTIRQIEHYDSYTNYDIDSNRYCVDYGNDHVFYDFDNTLAMEYDSDELKSIPFTTPNFISMVYTSEERLKSILLQDNFLSDIFIDNDHGLIVPIKKFIELGMPIKNN